MGPKSNMTDIPRRRGKSRHRDRDTQGECRVRVEAETGIMLPTSQGPPRVAGNHQTRGQKHGADSFPEPPRRK